MLTACGRQHLSDQHFSISVCQLFALVIGEGSV